MKCFDFLTQIVSHAFYATTKHFLKICKVLAITIEILLFGPTDDRFCQNTNLFTCCIPLGNYMFGTKFDPYSYFCSEYIASERVSLN